MPSESKVEGGPPFPSLRLPAASRAGKPKTEREGHCNKLLRIDCVARPFSEKWVGRHLIGTLRSINKWNLFGERKALLFSDEIDWPPARRYKLPREFA